MPLTFTVVGNISIYVDGLKQNKQCNFTYNKAIMHLLLQYPYKRFMNCGFISFKFKS